MNMKKAFLVIMIVSLICSARAYSQDINLDDLAYSELEIYGYPDRAPAAVPITDPIALCNLGRLIVFGSQSSPTSVSVTESYGPTRHQAAMSLGVGYLKWHDGWDISASEGTPILWNYSVPATVVEMSNSPHDGNPNTANYGYQLFMKVTISNRNFQLRLCHLQSDPSATWKKGQEIKTGMVISRVGKSGRPNNATNPHLHIESLEYRGNRWVNIDPLMLFSCYPPLFPNPTPYEPILSN